MSFVYNNVIIGNSLTVKPTGQVITTAKGDIISDDGTHSVRLPVGTNGQAILANSATSSGLEWTTLTPSEIGLIAGDGLTLTGSTLNVGGSSTIFANADDLVVNSSSTANQVLLSSGTAGTTATYGALPLGDSNAVTGILGITNGGTNASSFTAGSRVIATNSGNTALEATTIDPSTIVTLTGTQTLTNKTLTTPIITTSINDANGNELVGLTSTASAVNEVTVTNAATGSSPIISATGDDTNIDLNLDAKGTGNIVVSGLSYPNADGTSGQVLSTDGSGTLSFVNALIPNTGTVTTTDATPTNISSLTISTSSGTAYLVDAKFLARDTSGTDAASFIIRATFNNDAGSLSLVGTDLVYTPSAITWTADVAVSGTDIIFQVTGAAATNIDWKCQVNTITV